MKNIFNTTTKVFKEQREMLLNQNAKLIWFTGLSGSGKSTLAVHLESKLFDLGFKTYLLDGDNMRLGINKDLGFSDEDRVENIRRIGEVSKLLIDAGIIVLSAFISPFQSDRQRVQSAVGMENYIEVFVDCPLSVCEERDVKGLYKKARAGEIRNFTGISSPYESPEDSNIVVSTDKLNLEDSIDLLLKLVLPRISKK